MHTLKINLHPHASVYECTYINKHIHTYLCQLKQTLKQLVLCGYDSNLIMLQSVKRGQVFTESGVKQREETTQVHCEILVYREEI